MAFSNSFNYTETQTAADIIALALRRIGVYDPDETINTTEQSNALQVLNLLVKEWSAEGAGVWLADTIYMFLSSKTIDAYNTAGQYFARGHFTTQVPAGASSGAFTITVDNDDNIATTNIILVKLDDGTMHATTVNGAPVANVVTLTAALTGDVNENAFVYVFPTTSRVTEPFQNLLYASAVASNADTLNDETGGISTEVRIVGNVEYHNLSNKMQEGVPRILYHSKLYSTSEIHIWPVGGSQDYDRLELVTILPIQDLDATTNNLLLAAEGFNALGWGLAAEMASEYGLSEAEQRRLWQVAEIKKQAFLDNSVETASVIFEASR